MESGKELHEKLGEEYEGFILITQEEYLGKSDLYLGASTMQIATMFEHAFEQYPELKNILTHMLVEKKD